MSETTGILFNDEMDDFALPFITNFFGLPPARSNRIMPKKRPLSSMCPAVIVDQNTGHIRMVLGGAGGTKITSAVALVAIRHLLFEENLKEAIDAPRLHHQLYPNEIIYDKGFPAGVLALLKLRGHSIKELTGRGSVITGISRDPKTGTLSGTYDSKKKGSVEGF